LNGLAESFSALARFYARHYRPHEDSEHAPKLYISRLESGSVIAEIVPLIVLLGMAVPYMESALVVSEFTRRLWSAIKVFSGEAPSVTGLPSEHDAKDIREFVRPITGRKGASLAIAHARYEKKDGKKQTVVEYTFDEAELNRAALAIDSRWTEDILGNEQQLTASENMLLSEVMMFFQQASRAPGKEVGRTGDKAVVPEVSSKALPVYFRKGIDDLKDKMVREENALTNTFIVDVVVNKIDERPRGYVVTNVHRVIPED
jgi:hypothetical protein